MRGPGGGKDAQQPVDGNVVPLFDVEDRVVEQVEFVATLEEKAAAVDDRRPLENVGAGRIVAREAGPVGGRQGVPWTARTVSEGSDSFVSSAVIR